MALDAEPRFVMEIHSKSCTVKGAQVEVSSVNDDVRYLLEDASSEDTSMFNRVPAMALTDQP